MPGTWNRSRQTDKALAGRLGCAQYTGKLPEQRQEEA